MSRANYYLQTENNYYGLNIKYFLNLNKINNNRTFQSVPNLQYHKYLNSLYFRNLLYSVDYQFRNTAREIGYGYVQNALNVPVGLQFSLFKKYLSLGLWNDLQLSNVALMQSKNSSCLRSLMNQGNLGILCLQIFPCMSIRIWLENTTSFSTRSN